MCEGAGLDGMRNLRVVAATITAQNTLVAGFAARTPNFSRPPFTPLLGAAYREGDQWRWRQPYLEVVRAQ